jgi:hypothetical protein
MHCQIAVRFVIDCKNIKEMEVLEFEQGRLKRLSKIGIAEL